MPGLTYPMAVFILVLQEDATGHRAGLDATAPGAAGPAGRAAGHRGHTQLADRRAAGERTSMPSMPGAAPASRLEADVSVVRKAVQRMEYGTLTPTLILPGNWAAEVRKWLGDQRLRTMVLAPGANAAQQASASLGWRRFVKAHELTLAILCHASESAAV